MPISIPGAPTFHANVSLPAGADAPTRASIAAALEQLADRTRFLSTYGYIGANPRQITFSPIGGMSGSLKFDVATGLLSAQTLETGWRVHEDAFSGYSKGYVQCRSFGTTFYVDLSPHLRSGMELTTLEVHVDPGSAQATVGNRMHAKCSYITPSIDAETVLDTTFANATASAQTITLDLGGHVVNRVSRQYVVHVTSSQGADVGAEDVIRGFALNFTEPAGMGPRNY